MVLLDNLHERSRVLECTLADCHHVQRDRREACGGVRGHPRQRIERTGVLIDLGARIQVEERCSMSPAGQRERSVGNFDEIRWSLSDHQIVATAYWHC